MWRNGGWRFGSRSGSIDLPAHELLRWSNQNVFGDNVSCRGRRMIELLSPFLPYIAAAIGAVVLFLTGRASGRAKARQRQAEARAEAFEQTTKDVTHETLSDDPVDAIRDRLRERGRKP